MSDQITENTPEIVLGPNPTFGVVPLVTAQDIVLQVPVVPNNTPTITLATADNIFMKPIVLDPPAVLSAEDPNP